MAAGALLPGPAEAAVFAGAVFVLNATPGVDLLLTVGRTVQGGARAGMAAALGIGAGCVLHALAAAFGLAALLALHPAAFSAIQWAGAAWLAWLGLGMLRQAWRPQGGAAPAANTAGAAGTAEAAARRSLGADFRTGLLTNVLNPKVALFFLAFLPQFVPAASASPTASFLLLGAWFVAQGLLFLAAVVVVTAQAAQAARAAAGPGAAAGRPVLRRVLGSLGGLLFIGLALRLLGERPAGA